MTFLYFDYTLWYNQNRFVEKNDLNLLVLYNAKIDLSYSLGLKWII